MKRVLENFKSFILTVLIISSLFLTGSLWFDNYQGLSLLVSSLHNTVVDSFNTEEDISIVYDKIILPYKVTIVNPDKNKWVFYETDNVNTNAWKLAKDRLNSLTAETEIITGKVNEWDSLFTRKSIVLEFGGAIENDILKLAIPNLPKETNAFNNVEKIGITKSLEGITVYILQNDNNKKALYKVLLKGEDEEVETFMANCEDTKADVRYVELENVGTTKFYNNKEVVAQSSALFPISNKSTHRDLVKPIQTVPHFDLEEEYAINRFIIEIFNNTDFAKFVTNDESNIFINDDKSTIKFEKNGVVEYINNSKLIGEMTSGSKNFNAAMEFINDMRIYNDVYLLSANADEEGEYTFRYSVAFDGIIVGFDEPVIENDMHALLEIKVQEGNVRYFKGKLLDIKQSSNGTYISNFTHNILDNLLKEVEGDTKVNVSAVELLYIADNSGTYYPSWVVKYNEKKAEEIKTSLTYTVKR